MRRTAFANWEGSFKGGTGSITVQDSALCDVPFSYHSRFECEDRLSPEGLIAAALAASFVMSFEKHLDAIGLTSQRIDTTSTVKIEEINGLDTITEASLETRVHIGSLEYDRINAAATLANSDCSIARLIQVKIKLQIEVVGAAFSKAA
jgi:osmotically inducible protein OsmC